MFKEVKEGRNASDWWCDLKTEVEILWREGSNDKKLYLKEAYQPPGVIVVKFDQSLDVTALPVRRVEEGSWLAVAEVDVITAAAPLPLAVQGCVGCAQGSCNIPRHCHTSHGADYLEGKCGSSQDRGERHGGSMGRWSRIYSKQYRC